MNFFMHLMPRYCIKFNKGCNSCINLEDTMHISCNNSIMDYLHISLRLDFINMILFY